MAKIKKLPGMDVISGFKGTIDYYVHNGVPCARSWPRSPGKHRAPAVEAAWPAFSWAASYWVYLSQEIRDAYHQLAVGTNMTPRDLFAKGFINGTFLYLGDV